MTAWSVGQEVIFEQLPESWERNGKSSVHSVKLTKVGRVWAHFAYGHHRYRFPIEPDEVSGQFEVDGGDPDGSPRRRRRRPGSRGGPIARRLVPRGAKPID